MAIWCSYLWNIEKAKQLWSCKGFYHFMCEKVLSLIIYIVSQSTQHKAPCVYLMDCAEDGYLERRWVDPLLSLTFVP